MASKDAKRTFQVLRTLRIAYHACYIQRQIQERDQTEEYVKKVAEESTPVALTTREIERASENDPELQSVRECLLHGKWHDIEFKEYLPMRDALCAIGKLVLRGTQSFSTKGTSESSYWG